MRQDCAVLSPLRRVFRTRHTTRLSDRVRPIIPQAVRLSSEGLESVFQFYGENHPSLPGRIRPREQFWRLDDIEVFACCRSSIGSDPSCNARRQTAMGRFTRSSTCGTLRIWHQCLQDHFRHKSETHPIACLCIGVDHAILPLAAQPDYAETLRWIRMVEGRAVDASYRATLEELFSAHSVAMKVFNSRRPWLLRQRLGTRLVAGPMAVMMLVAHFFSSAENWHNRKENRRGTCR